MALECTMEGCFFEVPIAGLEFSLATHFSAWNQLPRPNAMISCILLALYFTQQD